MDNWIMDVLQLPEACQAEEVLPKHFLSQNFKLSTSEANLLSYSVDEIAIVGTLGETSGTVPPSLTMENAALLVVETKGGKFAKDAPKIANMLHQHIPQHLIIGLTDGDKACISIATKEVDTMEVTNHYITLPFSPEKVEEISTLLAFDTIAKDDMSVLWASYCKLIADLA